MYLYHCNPSSNLDILRMFVINIGCLCTFQSCPTPCDPIDCSPTGSSVHWILQARILELIAMPSSRGSSRPKDGTRVSYVSCTDRFFTTSTTLIYIYVCVCVLVTQLRLTLCNPMDCSPPGSSYI